MATTTKNTTNNPVFPQGETMYEDPGVIRNRAEKLADVRSTPHTNQASMAGCASREMSKTYLLNHADRLRRKANQIEALAYAIEHVTGDAEATLYGLLSGDFLR